jgi:hypothetical protein
MQQRDAIAMGSNCGPRLADVFVESAPEKRRN